MGQRLIVQIVEDEAILAAGYYHWSGYTSSALNILKSIIYDIDGGIGMIYRDIPQYYAQYILHHATGAGYNENNYTEIKDMYPNWIVPKCKDRNIGLIATAPEGINGFMEWCEGLVVIDIGSRMFDFEVVGWAPKEEAMKKDGWYYNPLIMKPAQVSPRFSLDMIPFEMLPQFLYAMEQLPLLTNDGKSLIVPIE